MNRDLAHAMTEQERARIEQLDVLVLRGAAGVDELLTALEDRSWTVRRAAVGALASLGDPAVLALAAWLATKRTSEHAIAAAVDAMVASVGHVTPVAIAMLADPVAAVACDGAAILGRRRTVGAVVALGAAVAHADDNVAVGAIEALGMIGGSVAVDPLIAVTRTRSFFRTFPALQVLARSGDPRAVAPLAELLDDEIFRYEAARALGRTGSVHAVPPLAELARRGGPAEVRLAALALADVMARATWTGAAASVATTMRGLLEPIAEALQAALGDAVPEERAALAAVLGAIGGASAVSSLSELLAEPALRGAATDAIQRIGGASEDALHAALGSDDPATRAAALPAVRSVRAGTDVRVLLSDEDPEVRARAAEALARIGDTSAVPELFSLLADPNPRVTQAVVAAIHSLGSAATPALARGALASPNANLRRHALRIIGYLGCEGCFDQVLAAAADRDGRVAELAVVALGVLEDGGVDAALVDLAGDPREGVRGAVMRAAGQRSTDPSHAMLLQGLADEAAWVRYYACQGLGRRGLASASPHLVSRMSDPAAHVRIAAIDALAQLDTPHAWQVLTTTVRSADPDEQRAALVGLGHHGRPAALPYLLSAECSDDVATRLIALAGLARQSDPTALSAIARAAIGAEEAPRDAALSLLAERDDRAAAVALVDAAVRAPADHPAHFALSRPGAARIAAITERLAAAEDATASMLASALARMNDGHAVDALRSLLSADSPIARRAAASALAAVGSDRQAIARMAKDDPDPEVRRVCAAASDAY